MKSDDMIDIYWEREREAELCKIESYVVLNILSSMPKTISLSSLSLSLSHCVYN